MNSIDKLDSLYGKPPSYKFTEKEKKYIKSKVPKDNFLVIYAVWKQKRNNNKYLCIIMDSMPYKTRPCAMDNSIDVVCTRMLSDIEYDEQIGNYGTNHRIYTCWNYHNIQGVIHDDDLYNIKTPIKFIEYCNSKGYNILTEESAQIAMKL